MKHNFQDLTGLKFCKLTVIDLDKSKPNRPYWICRCDCGNVVSVRADLLKNGNTKACGCIHNKHNQALQGKHSRIYSIYHDMKKRCYNHKNKSYRFYGGAGITICDEWMGETGFEHFYSWSISNGYSDSLSIDRINSKLPYSPENCRWVGWVIQANNKSNNTMVEYNGKTQSLANWCRELNLKYSKVRQRIYNGKTFEQAILGAEN